MKNIILFILFLASIFIVNIAFYYSSEEYRDFLKTVKTVSNKENNVKTWSIAKDYFSGTVEERKKEEEKNVTATKAVEDNKNTQTTVKQEVKLWKWYQDILDLFADYDLWKLEVSANLFDVTNEYPDNYYEYAWKKWFTLYLFTTKDYNGVLDVFKVIQNRFTVNETNNFGEKSFYINFDNDINDETVRIVIDNNWFVFWLKFPKTEYDNIKQKLQNFKK